jgi:small subunit ribosomal protein S4e
VISIERTSEHFRLLYNTKGRFAVHRIREEEAEYKLCRVRKVLIGAKGIPYLVTHDGRTIRYPNPDIKANDTVQVDVETGRIQGHLKFETGQLVMITGGHNVGRVGVLVSREKHIGSYEISHIQDAASKTFATRTSNVFVIGEGNKSYISLPKGKGIKLTIMEEAAAQKQK